MSRPVFYSASLAGETVVLDGAEGHHAADVRRLRAGEAVAITDGVGGLADATVVEVARGRVVALVEERRHVPPALPGLTVVLGILKADRMARAIEALTEIGADSIVPWAAERSVPVGRGVSAAAQRWATIAGAAARQARRARFPVVGPSVALAGAVELVAAASLAVVCDEGAVEPITGLTPPVDGEMVVVVGPEGGLSPEELRVLGAAGGRPVSLGPTILRAGTAGLVAAALLSARSRRWV